MNPRGLFITGTNTEVGKTYVTAQIAKALTVAGRRVGVYKPAASGCDVCEGKLVSTDAASLWEAAGRPETLEQVCPQLFAAPLAPHLAAREEGKKLDPTLLRTGLQAWDTYEIVLVEGAGGLMSPISDEDYVADLAWEFGFPLIVVAPNSLGVINQTLQTLITAATFRDGLDVAGVVLNDSQPPTQHDISHKTNAAELALHSVAPLLANVRHNDTATLSNVDWFAIASAQDATNEQHGIR